MDTTGRSIARKVRAGDRRLVTERLAGWCETRETPPPGPTPRVRVPTVADQLSLASVVAQNRLDPIGTTANVRHGVRGTEAVRAFLQASLDAQEWVGTHEDAARELVVHELPRAEELYDGTLLTEVLQER